MKKTGLCCLFMLRAVSTVMVAAFLFSCRCPEIAQVSKTTDTVTSQRIDTLYTSIDWLVPSDSSAVIQFNALTFCDSLTRGLIKLPVDIRSGKHSPTGKRKIIGSLSIDSTGIARILCRENEFKIRIDSLATVLKTKEITITNQEKLIQERSGYDFYLNGFWILLGLIVFTISLLILRK